VWRILICVLQLIDGICGAGCQDSKMSLCCDFEPVIRNIFFYKAKRPFLYFPRKRRHF